MTRWPKWFWERRKADLGEELDAHLRMSIADRISRGERPEEARTNALRELGNMPLIADVTRRQWGWARLEELGRNLRHAVRQLGRSPGFAVTAVLAMALGIGPNVAMFSIIWGTFLAPLPYPHPEQLVVVWRHYKGDRIPTGGDEYAELAAQSQSFQSLSFDSWLEVHLTNADHTADQEGGLAESPGLQSRTVGDSMQLGRDFRPDEGGPGNDHLVLLSNWIWQHRYNSDPQIVGKSILVEDEPYTVVGVMRAGPHERSGGVEFFVPVRLTPGVPTRQFGIMIGRIKPGVTLAQAQAELSVINRRYAAQHFKGMDPNTVSLTVERFRNDWLDVKTQRHLWLLFDAVGLVLLIACANIANLLLARGTARTQELAVRSALGASRRRIFAQLLTESLTLSLLGAAVGVGLGWGLMKLSIVYLPSLAIESTENRVEMNLAVLCFAALAAVMAGVIAGCAPAWRSARMNQSEALKQGARSTGGRGRTPLQAILVVAEMALALTLLAGAGMAMHSFWNLSRIDLGFRTDHVLMALLHPRNSKGGGSRPSPAQTVVQEQTLLDRVRQIPGVVDAGFATEFPMHGFGSFHFAVAGQAVDPAHAPTADLEAVSPGFFPTFGIRLVRGRLLKDDDNAQSPKVVVVNETFVRRYLADVDPLTRRLQLLGVRVPVKGANGNVTQPPPPEFQIVGVFHDVLDNQHLTGEVQPEMYICTWQAPEWSGPGIVLRTVAGEATSVTNALQRAVSAVQPGTAIDHVETMEQVLELERSSDQAEMLLFGAFAAVALVLAAVGIYGVMSFAVAQRTHEIGVRMALGAPRSAVIGLMMGRGMRMSLAGLGMGVAGALVLGRLMHSTLYGIEMADLWSLIAVGVLLLGVAVVACWIPARRSAAVDPMQALRSE
jgi:putative ABC transport system permease protein